MRVLLIYPPLTMHKLDKSPPSKSTLIGLGYIGAVLKKAGHEVKILDCLVSSFISTDLGQDFVRYGLSDEQILEQIKLFNPDVVGISCMFTPYFKDAHNIARITKEYNSNILVVFGGAHNSTFPEIVMQDKNVDISVIGEGEETIVELLERYKNKADLHGVRGVIHRVNGVIEKEGPRDFIENLDEIPFPAWELLENELEIIRKESKGNKFLMRQPMAHILTSRGCPNDCYFCSVKLAWSRKWRSRSAKNVVDEIEFLKNKYGYREFHFVDDNSSVSKKRMIEICDELIKRKLDVKLATPTGIAIATLDKEVLGKMKKAGFYRLCFGLETGNPQSQIIIKKRVNLEKAKEVIKVANSLGFWTSATFIFGFPHETLLEFNNTIRFTQETNMDFAIFYLLTPQPGTEVYNILKEQGLIDLDRYIDPKSEDWYKIGITYCNGFKTSLFSNQELQDILAKAYKDFLFYKLRSLSSYMNLVKKIKNWEDFRYMLGLASVPLNMILGMLLGNKLSNVSIRDKDKELSNIEDKI